MRTLKTYTSLVLNIAESVWPIPCRSINVTAGFTYLVFFGILVRSGTDLGQYFSDMTYIFSYLFYCFFVLFLIILFFLYIVLFLFFTINLFFLWNFFFYITCYFYVIGDHCFHYFYCFCLLIYYSYLYLICIIITLNVSLLLCISIASIACASFFIRCVIFFDL